MGLRGFAGAAALVVAVALGYSAYTPDNIEKWSPTAGAYARKAHDALLGETKARTSAQASTNAKTPTALVSVATTKRVDYPVYIN